MSGFIQGEDRFQATLFPESLDDYVAEDSSVRVIDVFLDDLDLSGLGFKTQPNDTGRPAYHPSTMLNLFANAFVAIDGSKFKAVNSRDRNFTRAKMRRRLAEVDASIERYLEQLAAADQAEPAEDKSRTLEDKIAAMRKEMARLKKLEARMLNAPDKQVSLTDPDARSMKTRGTGIVGYNVQTAVDTKHHLIVAHEVTNNGSDRRQLANMAKQAKSVIATEALQQLPIGATTGVRTSWTVTRPTSRAICPSRIPHPIGPRASMAVMPSVISLKMMSMNVRLAYVSSTT